MEPFGTSAIVTAAVFAVGLAVTASRKKSLSPAGAITGGIVGFFMVVTGLRGFTLLWFYQLGSWATKYKRSRKQSLDATASESSVRGPTQVLAVSALAVALSLVHAIKYGAEDSIILFSGDQLFSYEKDTDNNHNIKTQLTLAVLAHHATSLGDTLASEFGTLSSATPVLISNPMRRVPPGTNGGVTPAGTLWSFTGGMLCGLFTAAMDHLSGILDPSTRTAVLTRLALFGGICGALGSLIDSLLGAVFQATHWNDVEKRVYHHVPRDSAACYKLITGRDVLTNEQVNLVSVILTTYLGGYWIGPAMFMAA